MSALVNGSASSAGAAEGASLAEVQQDAARSDQLTLEQQQHIEKEIKESQPLVAPVESPSVLYGEYKGNPEQGFMLGVEDLAKRYPGIRRVRGDGSCFYRALLFSYTTSLVKGRLAGGDSAAAAEAAWKDLLTIAKDSKEWLLSVGYNDTAIDTFYEVFVEEIEALPTRTVEELEELFNEEQGVMAFCTWYLRLLTAGYLKLHRDEFAPFIEDGSGDVEGFCAREVEPPNRECEQIQIIALTRALNVGVLIEYLDGRVFKDHLNQIVFPEGSEPKVTLLYRPGHYDVLLAP